MSQEKNMIATTRAEDKVTAQATILVVDDSPTICRLVTTALERRGYQVFSAADGLEALAKMSDMLPDLILLDITMPRLDGYQLCKIIKSNKETKHTPVVMLSGKDGFFDKVKGRMAGAADYITKPFKSDTLLGAVIKHTNRRKS
jgi:twitching motility two-component system response regulator PilG